MGRSPKPGTCSVTNRVRVQAGRRSWWFGPADDVASWARARAFACALEGGQSPRDAFEACARADEPPPARRGRTGPPRRPRPPMIGPVDPPEPHPPGLRHTPVAWAELMVRFLSHAEEYYRKRDAPTNRLADFRRLSTLLLADRARASSCVDDFGPAALQAFRAELAAMQGADGRSRFARRQLNRMVKAVVQVVRWGESQELVQPGNADWLATLRAIGKGRPAGPGLGPVRESPKRRPPSEDTVLRTLEHCPPAIAAMVRLQMMSGMRVQEVCAIRTQDVHATHDPRVLVYRVPDEWNKLAHEEIDRLVLLGPRCRRALYPWLRLARKHGEEYVFSPRLSERIRRQRQWAQRTTPKWPSHDPELRAQRMAAKTGRPRAEFNDHYGIDRYYRAIQSACRKAGLPRSQWWGPKALRHMGSSRIARVASIHEAKDFLGHSDIRTTQIYTHTQMATLVETAARML